MPHLAHDQIDYDELVDVQVDFTTGTPGDDRRLRMTRAELLAGVAGKVLHQHGEADIYVPLGAGMVLTVTTVPTPPA